MLDEDLTIFFNRAEHAVRAVFSTPQGALVGEASVILSTPVQDMQLIADYQTKQLQPSIQCRTADVEGVRRNYKVEIDGPLGVTTYHVTGRDDDGTGLSIVWLRKE